MTGIGTLLRFFLCRERVRIPVYVLLFVSMVASTAVQSDELYPTAAARADYVATVTGNPGLIAMVGPPYDVTTVGGDVAWQLGGIGAAFVALMSMFFVGRHTRGEEQSGRSELVGAAPVGRHAPLAAAMIVAAGAQVLLGAAVALTMIGLGEPSAGSLAFGASLTGVGLVFAGVAAVAMQVSQGTSSAYGMTGAAIGGAYLARAAVANMAAALRPGGWLVVEDYDWPAFGADPADPLTERVAAGVTGFMAESGFDPSYGRRAVSDVAAAGLEEVRGEGRLRVIDDAHPGFHFFRLSFEALRSGAIAAGKIDAGDADAFAQRLAEGGLRVITPVVLAAIGRRPA